jgi:hypothetical protein
LASTDASNSTTFQRCGGRKEIIVPHVYENTTLTKRQAQNALVMAVVRGRIWRDLLESGKAKSIAEIARVNKVDGSYVSRMLDLILLSPDIIEAILDGKEPSGLSLAMLTKKQIPLSWDEQRRYFDFQVTQ